MARFSSNYIHYPFSWGMFSIPFTYLYISYGECCMHKLTSRLLHLIMYVAHFQHSGVTRVDHEEEQGRCENTSKDNGSSR